MNKLVGLVLLLLTNSILFGQSMNFKGIQVLGLSPAYYALNYGLKCDNSTNDSSALQTLINTVSSSGTQGGTITLPAGTTCLMGSTKITLPLNVIIAGQGAASSQLSWTGGTALIVVGSPTPGQMTLNGQNVINHAGLRDLTVNGPSATGSSICLFLGGDPAGVISTSTNFAPYVVFQNVTIDNCGVGTELGNNSYIAEFHNVRWTFNGQHWVDLATNSNAGERMVISASAFILAQSTTAPGMALNGTDSEYDISDTSFDFNGTASGAPDVNTSGTSAYLRFNCTGCHFEKTTVNGGSGFVSQTGSGKANFRFAQSSFSDDASSGTIACMLCNSTSGGTTSWVVRDSDVIPGGTTTAFLTLGSNASQVMVQSLSYAPFGGAPASGITGSSLTHLCIQNTVGLTSVTTGC